MDTHDQQHVDEQCTCGHLKSMHGTRYAPGHGACNVRHCDCGQFTWKQFLSQDEFYQVLRTTAEEHGKY